MKKYMLVEIIINYCISAVHVKLQQDWIIYKLIFSPGDDDMKHLDGCQAEDYCS